MATTASKPGNYTARDQEFPLTRGARIGLLLLLIVTIVFASGVLFVKYQLEAFRAEVATGLEERFGARLAMGSISVNGLRGLRIEQLKMEFPLEQGPILKIGTPSAYIHIGLTDLFYGRIAVERIVLNESDIVLERPPGAAWYSADAPSIEEVIPFQVSRSAPFRLTGTDCHLEIKNIVGDTKIDIEDFTFDVARLEDASDLNAALQGHLEGDPRKSMSVRLGLASFEDFDLRVKTDLITAEDVNVFLPADRQIVGRGTVHPTLWVNGRPNRTLFVSLEAPFETIVLRDQPEFLDPLTGNVTVSATYSVQDQNLHVTTAKAETGQIDGSVEGSISFDEERPKFDLRLHARRIPIREILDYSLEGELEDIGRMDLILDEPHELEITLTGTSQDPVFRGQTRAAAGRFEFLPKDKVYPPVQLALRQIEGAWDSYTQDVKLEFDVSDGTIPYEQWGVAAESLRGHFALENNVVTVAPLNAVYRGNTFVGDGDFDLATGDGRLRFEGTLAGIENTALADAIKNTRLAGAVSVKGEATRKDGNVTVDADVDATQAEIGYQWWLRKEVGLGANGHIRAAVDPKAAATIEAVAEVASSSLVAQVNLVRSQSSESGWDVDTATATSERMDINAAAKLAVVPYRVTGGTARMGYFEFTHDPDNYAIVRQRFGAYLDDVSLLAVKEGATNPITGKGVTVEIAMQTDTNGNEENTASARLDSDQLNVPAFGETWLVPVPVPEGWEPIPRNWSIDLRAADMELPPWKGREFEGHAYATPTASGITPYRAIVGDGVIEGTFEGERSDNTYDATIVWTDIPAHFLLEHLKMPSVLEGTVSGNVNYSIDRDDPNTLNGKGRFDVRDGRFNADFLYDILEGKMRGDVTSLPPKLDFKLLQSDVQFVSDTVKTPTLRLDSDILRVEGAGQYIRDGDMDYDLKVAVSPDTAARIPLMASSFNLQGHRLSNTPIELTFKISGPTFNPRGKVEELPPASVTLMSGALEVGRETLDLITFPRKILIDLLKIGGGIVGGGDKQN